MLSLILPFVVSLNVTLPEFMDKNEWTKLNTALELVLFAEGLADIMQTRWFVGREVNRAPYPEGTIYVETNPILGRKPGAARLYSTFISAMILHAAVARILPSGFREAWQISLIGIEGEVLYHNYKTVGAEVRLSF